MIFNNFGRRKNDSAKQRKVADEYVRLCGYSANGDRTTECQNGTRLTLDEIAHQLGTSKRELQRALRIERNLTDSMKELLDNGINIRILITKQNYQCVQQKHTKVVF